MSTTTTLNVESTVGSWVAHYPETARVFEALGIDYCCGGKVPLAQACRERSIETERVLQQLQAAAAKTDREQPDWTTRPLAELCDHIEQTHHAYLKTELPRLAGLIDKVVRAHHANHPELARLPELFGDLRADLEPHMFKEERILFPAIRALERSGPQPFPFGSVANPIRMMELEHDHAGDCLAAIRELTWDFRVPEDACNTYRVLLDSLERLESDMHVHVHKENNILFPRAIEREAQGN